MGLTTYEFTFLEEDNTPIRGALLLEDPHPYPNDKETNALYRPGTIQLEDEGHLEIVLYHCPATAAFMYLRSSPYDRNLLDLVGLNPGEGREHNRLILPGQLCMGPDRTRLIGQATHLMFASPTLRPTIISRQQHNMAIFPIAREGLKYQVADAIFENYGFYCDEVLLDAHHVFDSSVPVYRRKVLLGLFKDKDLDKQQHENINAAFIADSIASGLVMREVIARVMERFDRLEHVEVIAPLATIRGLCRIARSGFTAGAQVRVHVFETLLNALPPDYYYSAHINAPELHIRPDLEAEYRQWWGQDADGRWIADTACAGYGWSEVFYSPRKQIEMMNEELSSRHGLTITDILRRHL